MRTMVLLMVALMAVAGAAVGARAGSLGDAVEVRIISDNGSELPIYPVSQGPQIRKAYAEATRGDQYSIVVRNRLNRRVGIVVAVDGRNIISGRKSWLGNDERMYVLGPYAEGTFKGWRTGDDRINRFYFTTAADSYAAAFNDESAMGVIAVAVYPEVQHYEPLLHGYRGGSMSRMPAPSTQKKAMASERDSESAGTGYGREEYSPVRIVTFEPQDAAVERVFVKYEWRETLRRKGIVAKGCHVPWQGNRMWDNDGYAPPPPGRD